MTFLTVMQFIVNIIIIGFLLTVMVIGLIWLIKDKRQSQCIKELSFTSTY